MPDTGKEGLWPHEVGRPGRAGSRCPGAGGCRAQAVPSRQECWAKEARVHFGLRLRMLLCSVSAYENNHLVLEEPKQLVLKA